MADNRTKAADEGRIRALIDAVSTAIRSKDADGVVRHHAAGLVHFSLAPPLQSTEAAARSLTEWFATWQGPIGYEIRNLSIAVGADVAFCHSLNRMTGERTDGGHTDVWFRLTLGLRKIGGTWKIVHEHESVPFYMDGSMRAATDLRP